MGSGFHPALLAQPASCLSWQGKCLCPCPAGRTLRCFSVQADETLLEVSVYSSYSVARETKHKHLACTENHNVFALNTDLLVLK